jgi:hypothetical protein
MIETFLFQIPVPLDLIDRFEAEFAPPDHEVFQLTPPEFHMRASGFYDTLGQPPITRDTFWLVYNQVLDCFKIVDDELLPVVEGLFDTVRRVEEDGVELLPGQKELRMGGKVVGGDGDSEIYLADITDSSEGDEADADEVAYASFSDEGDAAS